MQNHLQNINMLNLHCFHPQIDGDSVNILNLLPSEEELNSLDEGEKYLVLRTFDADSEAQNVQHDLDCRTPKYFTEEEVYSLLAHVWHHPPPSSSKSYIINMHGIPNVFLTFKIGKELVKKTECLRDRLTGLLIAHRGSKAHYRNILQLIFNWQNDIEKYLKKCIVTRIDLLTKNKYYNSQTVNAYSVKKRHNIFLSHILCYVNVYKKRLNKACGYNFLLKCRDYLRAVWLLRFINLLY